MSNISVGDMTQSLIFNRRGASLKSAMQTLSTEATTGLVSDQSARLKGNFVPIAGIEASLSQLDTYQSVTSEIQVITGVMQNVIGTISDQALNVSTSLLAAGSNPSSSQIDAYGADATHRLEAAISALNTRVGERSLFSGQETGKTAVASVDTMLTALQTAITASGAVSASDVEAAVSAWFGDPAGYQATVYQGGDLPGPVMIGPDQSVQIDVTAQDPALLETLKGMAMAALLSHGVLAGNTVARADLARQAGALLAGSQTVLARLGARLGSTEATIQNAATRNSAEAGVLQTARLNLLSVDPYETASKYQEAQGQLQTLFALTARVARLRLVDFL